MPRKNLTANRRTLAHRVRYAARYPERVPRYLSAADVRVDADAPPEEAAGRVFRAVCAFLSEKP